MSKQAAAAADTAVTAVPAADTVKVPRMPVTVTVSAPCDGDSRTILPDGVPFAEVGAWITVGSVFVGLAKETVAIKVPAKVLGTKSAQYRPRTSYRTVRTVTRAVDDFEWEQDIRAIKVPAKLAGLMDSHGDIRVPLTVHLSMVGWGEGATGATDVTLYRHTDTVTGPDGETINRHRWESDPASENAQVVTDAGRIMVADVRVKVAGDSLILSAKVAR